MTRLETRPQITISRVKYTKYLQYFISFYKICIFLYVIWTISFKYLRNIIIIIVFFHLKVVIVPCMTFIHMSKTCHSLTFYKSYKGYYWLVNVLPVLPVNGEVKASHGPWFWRKIFNSIRTPRESARSGQYCHHLYFCGLGVMCVTDFRFERQVSGETMCILE